jgi:hypothetical protein
MAGRPGGLHQEAAAASFVVVVVEASEVSDQLVVASLVSVADLELRLSEVEPYCADPSHEFVVAADVELDVAAVVVVAAAAAVVVVAVEAFAAVFESAVASESLAVVVAAVGADVFVVAAGPVAP